MKIIKEGDIRRLNTTRRFECPACGCIWLANASEYRREWDLNDAHIVCNCPTCHKYVYREINQDD